MKERILESEGLPTELKSFSNREKIWVWNYLKRYDLTPIHVDWYHLNNSIRNNIINKTISSPENNRAFLLDAIIRKIKDQIVPSVHLKWIEKNNQRLLIWIILEMANRHNKKYKDLPVMRCISKMPSSTYYDNIVTIIDSWPRHFNIKIELLNQLKSDWAKYRCSDKETCWINAKDTKQVKWAWEYLKERSQSIDLLNPVTNEDFYSAILASFDKMSYCSTSNKTRFLNRMKKSWDQKNSRDSKKAEKPCYVSLTENARKQLDWLSAHYNLQPADVIERLIKQDYAKNQQSKKLHCL